MSESRSHVIGNVFILTVAITMRSVCDYFVISMHCWRPALQRQLYMSSEFWQN